MSSLALAVRRVAEALRFCRSLPLTALCLSAVACGDDAEGAASGGGGTAGSNAAGTGGSATAGTGGALGGNAGSATSAGAGGADGGASSGGDGSGGEGSGGDGSGGEGSGGVNSAGSGGGGVAGQGNGGGGGSATGGNGGSGGEPPFCGGFAGFTCDEDEYCAYEPGQFCGAADASSVCLPRPESCPAIFMPVCACDGMTYSNDCVAAAAGSGVFELGECDDP